MTTYPIYDILQSNRIPQLQFKVENNVQDNLSLRTDNGCVAMFVYDNDDGCYVFSSEANINDNIGEYPLATTFSIKNEITNSYILYHAPLDLIFPARELVATASSTVVNGHTSTDNIVFETGKSFVPGQTYIIYATYSQTGNYEESIGVGELEILKKTTSVSISGMTDLIFGENSVITVAIKDVGDNSLISEGVVTLYDGVNIIQNNYLITGTSTSITFSPQHGVHDIYAIYSDPNGYYNNSISNHITVNVRRHESNLSLMAGEHYNNEKILLNIGVVDENDDDATTGSITLQPSYIGETIYNTSSLSDWVWKKANGTTLTPTAPTINVDGSMDSGVGMTVRSVHGFDVGYIQNHDFTVTCKIIAGRKAQRVGMLRLTVNNNDEHEITANRTTSLGDLLPAVSGNNLDNTLVHTLTWKYLDGSEYLYVDGEYSGKSYDWNSVTGGGVAYPSFYGNGTGILVYEYKVIGSVDITEAPILSAGGE